MNRYPALALPAPLAAQISTGAETRLDVRRWRPSALPLRDLLLVETAGPFPSADPPENATGRAVALVDVVDVTDWLDEDYATACAVCADAGYFVWHLANIRPIHHARPVPARRGLYELELPAPLT